MSYRFPIAGPVLLGITVLLFLRGGAVRGPDISDDEIIRAKKEPFVGWAR